MFQGYVSIELMAVNIFIAAGRTLPLSEHDVGGTVKVGLSKKHVTSPRKRTSQATYLNLLFFKVICFVKKELFKKNVFFFKIYLKAFKAVTAGLTSHRALTATAETRKGFDFLMYFIFFDEWPVSKWCCTSATK